jgi:hypothetical protein
MASPGFVMTQLGRHVKHPFWKMILFVPVAAIFIRTPYQGSQTILHCVLSEKLNDESGNLYRNCKKSKELGDLIKDNFTTKSVFEKSMKAILPGLKDMALLV